MRGLLQTASALVLVGTLLGGGQTAAGQVGFPGAPDDKQAVNLRAYPVDFWGPRVGLGVGILRISF